MLWVKLVLHDAKCQLEEGLATMAELYETLRSLPQDLEEYYKLIATDLPRPRGRHQQDRPRKILMLVSGISEIRPLTMEQLWEAMSVPLEMTVGATEAARQPETLLAGSLIPPKTYDEFRRILQVICGPFLEFLAPIDRRGCDSIRQSRLSVVQLIHQTVKDFLATSSASGSLHFTSEEARAFAKQVLRSYRKLTAREYHRLLESAALAHATLAKTQMMNKLIIWLNGKALLPCAGLIVHDIEGLPDFRSSTLGHKGVFSLGLLLSNAAELGHRMATSILLLIHEAESKPWRATSHNDIIHHIILAAIRSGIPAFKFKYSGELPEPGFEVDDLWKDTRWVTMNWNLTATYEPKQLTLSTSVRGWIPELQEICFRSSTGRARIITSSGLPQKSPVDSTDVEKCIAMVMMAARKATRPPSKN
ncbi:hypothetical protein PG987_000229 [Apiospora arundinis]